MRVSLLVTFLLLFAAGSGRAGIVDELLTLDAAQLELQAPPLVKSFNAFLNQGLYHNGASHGVPGFDVGVKALFLVVPEDKREGLLDLAGVDKLVLPVLHGSVGLMNGFQVSGRFFMADLGEKLGPVTDLGAGLRFEFNEIFNVPLVMPRIGLQYFLNSFSLGDEISTLSHNYDLIVSKKLIFVEPYGGFGFSRTTMKFAYTFEVMGFPGQEISTSFTEQSSHLVLGLNVVPFPLLRLNAAYTLNADYHLFNLGLLVNFL
jgi:hypothetical protein